MENLYYLPISLVENVLFEQPENGLALNIGGELFPLEFSNLELQKYYEHYYIHMQEHAKGIEYTNDEYKIPIGIEFDKKKVKLMAFVDFQMEFDATHLSSIQSYIFNFDGEEKEFFLVQFEKTLLEEVAFNNEEISINLGKWEIHISSFLIPMIISSLSENDKKAILAYEEKGEELELVGLLFEPDFDDNSKNQMVLKKL